MSEACVSSSSSSSSSSTPPLPQPFRTGILSLFDPDDKTFACVRDKRLAPQVKKFYQYTLDFLNPVDYMSLRCAHRFFRMGITSSDVTRCLHRNLDLYTNASVVDFPRDLVKELRKIPGAALAGEFLLDLCYGTKSDPTTNFLDVALPLESWDGYSDDEKIRKKYTELLEGAKRERFPRLIDMEETQHPHLSRDKDNVPFGPQIPVISFYWPASDSYEIHRLRIAFVGVRAPMFETVQREFPVRVFANLLPLDFSGDVQLASEGDIAKRTTVARKFKQCKAHTPPDLLDPLQSSLHESEYSQTYDILGLSIAKSLRRGIEVTNVLAFRVPRDSTVLLGLRYIPGWVAAHDFEHASQILRIRCAYSWLALCDREMDEVVYTPDCILHECLRPLTAMIAEMTNMMKAQHRFLGNAQCTSGEMAGCWQFGRGATEFSRETIRALERRNDLRAKQEQLSLTRKRRRDPTADLSAFGSMKQPRSAGRPCVASAAAAIAVAEGPVASSSSSSSGGGGGGASSPELDSVDSVDNDDVKIVS